MWLTPNVRCWQIVLTMRAPPDCPAGKGLIAFEDCVLEFVDGGIQQRQKSEVRDCYTSIPEHLAYRPSDEYQAWFRQFFTTCTSFGFSHSEIKFSPSIQKSTNQACNL